MSPMGLTCVLCSYGICHSCSAGDRLSLANLRGMLLVYASFPFAICLTVSNATLFYGSSAIFLFFSSFFLKRKSLEMHLASSNPWYIFSDSLWLFLPLLLDPNSQKRGWVTEIIKLISQQKMFVITWAFIWVPLFYSDHTMDDGWFEVIMPNSRMSFKNCV